MQCTCGMCGFDEDKFLNGQAAWFVKTPRERALKVWNKWMDKKGKEYMNDLRIRIKRLNGNG